jgi:hypothetical protein
MYSKVGGRRRSRGSNAPTTSPHPVDRIKGKVKRASAGKEFAFGFINSRAEPAVAILKYSEQAACKRGG